ncbi:hypothetical protein D9757_013030 [Collybiopsis confluens]|uniref:DUF6534 domain-containing protein n=1 Tax=Collybiopsis confluens TaxID=2823264 RepID=A0A8H5LIU9_9AGAR|nr:hypothetical protein D9757_013030 [Collybiopsis confluens]
MLTSTEFSLLASGWGNYAALGYLGTGWFDLPVMSGVSSAVIQCFYARRLHALSKSGQLFGLIVVLALTQCAGALALGIIIDTSIHSPAELRSSKHANIASIVWLIGSATCDLVISMSTLYLLSRARRVTGSNSTRSIISQIIVFTVGGGLLTAGVAILDVILYLGFPHTNLHFAAAFILPKLYINALMVILNNRIRNLDNFTLTCQEGGGGFSGAGSIDTIFSQTHP